MLTKLLTLMLCCFSVSLAEAHQAPVETNFSVLAAEVCKAPVVAKSDEPPIVEVIRKKFGPLRPKEERIRTVVVQSNVVNAYTHNISAERAIICLPTATIKLMDGAEAELAFIMGHEIGHALDKTCKAVQAQAKAANAKIPVQLTRECEKRADEIGFALIRRAGYSPFAAAGAFGRLEMFYGGTRTGLLAEMSAGDHPITPDRIEDLRHIMATDVATAALNP